MSKRLLLLDGHSILFRAFYGVPLTMTAPDGLHTNAIFGFLNIMDKVMEEEKPDAMAVAFDLPAPTFRHELYHAYKGTRGAAPDEFREQVPVMMELLRDMEIPVITAEGFEADDILGTLAASGEEKGYDVTLVSGDRDLLQIASTKTQIVIPKTRGGQTTYYRYDPARVKEEYGVTPEGFIELKALMGDSSDNIPGLPGVGPKTAQKIMETYGSIANAYAHLEEIKPKKAMEAMRDHYDDLLLAQKLVTILRDAPVAFDEESFAVGGLYNEKSYEIFKRLGMKSFLGRFQEETCARDEKTDIELITSRSGADEAFLKAASSDRVGLSFLAVKGYTLAVGIAGPEGITRVILKNGDPGEESGREMPLDDSYLLGKMKELLDSGTNVSVCGAKQLLRAVPSPDRGRIFDPVIAAYLLDPLKSDWSYDGIAAMCLGRNVPTKEELIGKKGLPASGEDDKTRDGLQKLAAVMAEVSFDTAPLLREKLRDAGMEKLFDEVEMPLVYVLASMENAGILASREELKNYGDSLKKTIDDLTLKIYEAAGEEFNINSPKQLGQILFEKLKMPGGKKTKTGFSTAADVLEKLAPAYPIVSDILKYRTYSKLKSTYADGLPAYIEEDGRIRTTFHQTITATGRLSSADPNLQNIPMREELGRRIRKCFYPKEGCVFVDADYSQIELRILAHMSGDEKLIEAYREAKDIHRITASQVFHIPFDDVTDLMRRNAKAVNFGIVYGISSFGLSQGLSISRKEAEEYIRQYFATYPKIKAFLDGLVESARETGFAFSLFGRRRPIPELQSSNFMQRSFGERAAMNSPIQGTAADIMKIGMIRVYRRLKEELPEAALILQIHDELLVEVPESLAKRAEEIVTEEMTRAASLSVALVTDSHIGRDWYEAK